MNTGPCDGSEVVQLYLSSSADIGRLGRPQVVKSLAGFQKSTYRLENLELYLY